MTDQIFIDNSQQKLLFPSQPRLEVLETLGGGGDELSIDVLYQQRPHF